MYWPNRKRLTPEQVKQLPAGTEVHLEGHDRHGDLTWLEGTIVQCGKSKVFAWWDQTGRQMKSIKNWPSKHWTVNADE